MRSLEAGMRREAAACLARNVINDPTRAQCSCAVSVLRFEACCDVCPWRVVVWMAPSRCRLWSLLLALPMRLLQDHTENGQELLTDDAEELVEGFHEDPVDDFQVMLQTSPYGDRGGRCGMCTSASSMVTGEASAAEAADYCFASTVFRKECRSALAVWSTKAPIILASLQTLKNDFRKKRLDNHRGLRRLTCLAEASAIACFVDFARDPYVCNNFLTEFFFSPRC